MPEHLDNYVHTAPVGSFPANALGLYDLAGNVSELCDGWWNEARQARIYRGGNWGTIFQITCRSSRREMDNRAPDHVKAKADKTAPSVSSVVADTAVPDLPNLTRTMGFG